MNRKEIIEKIRDKNIEIFTHNVSKMSEYDLKEEEYYLSLKSLVISAELLKRDLRNLIEGNENGIASKSPL